jgi:caa(3)-type oxidase subunit IV
MSGHGHHRNYVKIWGILMVLLVVSVVGPMAGIPLLTLITAFGIAMVKAYMVAKNFMHLDVEKPIIHWMMGIALIFMVLLFAGVSPDVMKDKGRRWQKDAGFHPVEAIGHGSGHGAAGHGDAGTADPHATPTHPGEAGHDATPAFPKGDAHDSTGSGH